MALKHNPFDAKTNEVKIPKSKMKKQYSHFKAFETPPEIDPKRTQQPPNNHPTKDPTKDPTTTQQPPNKRPNNHPTTTQQKTQQPAHNQPTTGLQPAHNQPTTGLQPAHNWPTTSPQLAHNWPTTSPQLAHNWPTTSPQLAHNWPTNQPTNQPTTSPQLAHNEIAHKKSTKASETINFNFEKLSQLKKKIMLVLFQDCLEKGKTETGFISSKQLSEAIGAPIKSIKGTISRLKKKEKCIWTVDILKWKNGGTRYKLSDDAYKGILKFKQTQPSTSPQLAYNQPTTSPQLAHNWPTNQPTNQPTSACSSSSIYNINKTTTTTGGFPKLGSKLKYRKASKIWVLELPISNKFRNLAMYQLKKFKGASTILLMT